MSSEKCEFRGCWTNGRELLAVPGRTNRVRLCSPHYVEVRAQLGSTLTQDELEEQLRRNPTMRTCDVPGCDNKHIAHKRCTKHYERARRGGWFAEDPAGDEERHTAYLAANPPAAAAVKRVKKKQAPKKAEKTAPDRWETPDPIVWDKPVAQAQDCPSPVDQVDVWAATSADEVSILGRRLAKRTLELEGAEQRYKQAMYDLEKTRELVKSKDLEIDRLKLRQSELTDDVVGSRKQVNKLRQRVIDVEAREDDLVDELQEVKAQLDDMRRVVRPSEALTHIESIVRGYRGRPIVEASASAACLLLTHARAVVADIERYEGEVAHA